MNSGELRLSTAYKCLFESVMLRVQLFQFDQLGCVPPNQQRQRYTATTHATTNTAQSKWSFLVKNWKWLINLNGKVVNQLWTIVGM